MKKKNLFLGLLFLNVNNKALPGGEDDILTSSFMHTVYESAQDPKIALSFAAFWALHYGCSIVKESTHTLGPVVLVYIASLLKTEEEKINDLRQLIATKRTSGQEMVKEGSLLLKHNQDDPAGTCLFEQGQQQIVQATKYENYLIENSMYKHFEQLRQQYDSKTATAA